jgi:CheY-like chemotaxis protein
LKSGPAPANFPVSTETKSILLVEDNEDDVFIMRRVMQKARINLPLHVAGHGAEALDYLTGKGKYANRTEYPLPSVIFLDLKMPYLDGFEVLKRMRGIPGVDQIPVIVLTSSPEQRDRETAELLGARGFRVKPPTGDMIGEVLQSVCGLSDFCA